jgi:hypothetical protein
MLDLTIDMPDERRLIARLEAFPDELQQRLAGPIERLTQMMLARAQAAEPSRTGLLRADTQSSIRRGRNFIRGQVHVAGDGGAAHNIRAAALEYGAHGAARVAAHEMLLGHLWSEEMSPREVLVEEYTRQVNVSAIHFLHDAVAGMQDQLRAEVEEAIRETSRGF